MAKRRRTTDLTEVVVANNSNSKNVQYSMVEVGVEASVCVLGLGSRADAQSPHGLRFWSRGFN